MVRKLNLLIVSSRLEMKHDLLRVLDGFPLNVYAAGSVKQAEDALSKHAIHVVLCDERISDGTYHDVLALTIDVVTKIQFILLLTTGGREEYREAMQLGVTEVVHSRFEPTDIELALIHAIREQTPAMHVAA